MRELPEGSAEGVVFFVVVFLEVVALADGVFAVGAVGFVFFFLVSFGD